MVSSMGIKYENSKTKAKMHFIKKEKPIIVQIFGNSIEETVLSAKFASQMGADGLDFNCGCPARSMIASGNGGKLLLEPDKLIAVLSAIKKNIKLPLSLKTRIGYDQKLPVSFYKDIVKKSHIDCLILHGRTVKQKYQGLSDWEHIKKISQKLSVPVIGNGDITDAYLGQTRIKEFTPAGIMIGRGALGNPSIFQQIKKLLSGHVIRPRHSLKKNIKTMMLHYKLLTTEFLNDHYYQQKFSPKEIKFHALCNMRKHFGWYFKGFPGAKSIRIDLLQINHPQKLNNYLHTLLKNN